MPAQLPPSLRRELARLGPPARSRRYPPAVRASAIAWARAQRAAGATVEEVSAALGIPWQTLQRWSFDTVESAFKPVELVEEAPSGLVVHGPCGLRVEGLDVTTLASLLRMLA
jgi:hypothetical protein